MKKGYTLVELLGVLALLAIIALIVLPAVMNIIIKVDKDAGRKSLELYRRAIEKAVYKYKIDNSVINVSGVFESSNNGEVLTKDDIVLNIDYDNSKIKCDTIKITEKGSAYLWDCRVGDDEEEYSIKPSYTNGEVVYFNVDEGKSCTEDEYKESLGTYETYIWDEDKEELVLREIEDYGNSKSGYNGIDNKDEHQNSCLKFYAFLDDEESESVNLILDHNVAISYWTDSDYNWDGPLQALVALEDATEDWEGTLELENYNYNNEYTIDYSDFKARLITASEVAEIVGNKTFNEQTSSGNSSWFWLDTLGQNKNEIYNKESSFYKYGWLYDRLNVNYDNIKKYGIPNIEINASDYSDAYWTSVASSDNDFFAWSVSHDLLNTELVSDLQLGIRPVIEVLKINAS